MKILYDHQIFNRQKHGGISRYFFEIMQHLKKDKIAECFLAILYTDNAYLNTSSQTESSNIRKINASLSTQTYLLKLKSRLRHSAFIRKVYDASKLYVNKRFSIQHIKKQAFDVFHPTYYDPYFLPYLKGKPFVITVHDMIHEVYPHYFRTTDTTAAHKKQLAHQASKIIAVSENTKKDIIRILHIPPEKIEVVYHGSSLHLTPAEPVPISSPYILFVGGRSSYKNFNFFVHAITPFLKEHMDCHLVCAGADPFNKIETLLFKELSIENQIIHLPVNDAKLAYLYAHARIFVFPSLYEGFGIPILEALANQCPVVLSNRSCFPEIAQDAAIYFDPEDKCSIKDAIEKVYNDENLRHHLIKLGNERLKELSWKKAAEKTYNVYKEVVQQ